MKILQTALFACLLFPTVSLAQQPVTLRYRFGTGDDFRYRVEHELRVSQQAGGKEQNYTSDSRSIWKLTVEQLSTQAATIVLVVDQIQVHAKLPTGKEIVIDSSRDTQHPLAKLAGKPLARFDLSPSGVITDWQQLQPDVQGPAINVQLFFVRLPERPVSVGDRWSHEFEMPLPLATNSGETVRFQQVCQLTAIDGDIARIGVQVKLAQPDKVDARVRSLVAQFQLKGTVEFNRTTGQIVAADYLIEDEVTGFAGENSRLTVSGRLTQRIELPVARRDQ